MKSSLFSMMGRSCLEHGRSVAAAEFLELVNCDHRLERLGRAIDLAYSQFRSPLDKVELIIDIREL